MNDIHKILRKRRHFPNWHRFNYAILCFNELLVRYMFELVLLANFFGDALDPRLRTE